MRYSVFLLLSSALCSMLLARPAIRYAHAVGAIDVPDGKRHRHAYPTARLGGLALFFTSLILALLFLPSDRTVFAWLSGGALLCVLGIT